MIGRTNAGSSGEGISSHNAVLDIRALTGSTITIKKDNIILQVLYGESGVVYEDQSFLAAYYYAIPAKDFGEIEIIADYDEDSYTKTVLVNTTNIYSVDMQMKRYLFKNGEEYVDIMGGWFDENGYSGVGWTHANNGAATRVVRNGQNLYCDSGNTGAVAATINKINLKYFSIIHHEGYRIRRADYGTQYNNPVCIQASGATRSKSCVDSAARWDYSNTGPFTYDLNIVSLEDSYYICFATGDATNCIARCEIIYLQ